MKADDLFRGINDIDDDLIHDADNNKQKSGIRLRKMLCTAAAFVVLAVGLTAVIYSSDPGYTLKDKHNVHIITDDKNESTVSHETTFYMTTKHDPTGIRETAPAETAATDTTHTHRKEPDTTAIPATESPDAYEPDTEAPPEDTIPSDTDKSVVDTDDFNKHHKKDLSGIALEEWLNDESVIWAENDLKGTGDTLTFTSGTAVISPELLAVTEKYPEEETVFAVIVYFSPSAHEETDTEYYPERLQDFKETFVQNGLGIYPCESGGTFFYTFGTAAHFEEFVCSENEAFIFLPAGDFR